MAAKTQDFLTLHTVQRKIDGKKVEIKPNSVIDLDPVADKDEIDHLLAAKAIKPYQPENNAPVRVSTKGKKAASTAKADDGGAPKGKGKADAGSDGSDLT